MISKLKSIYRRFFRKKICADCKVKLDRHFGLKSRIKHGLKRHSHRIRRHGKRRSVKHKLRAGIHKVKIRGKMRRVKVLSSGQWRFMKSR